MTLYTFDFRPTAESDTECAVSVLTVTNRTYNNLEKMDALFAKLRSQGIIEVWAFDGEEYDHAYDLVANA